MVGSTRAAEHCLRGPYLLTSKNSPCSPGIIIFSLCFKNVMCFQFKVCCLSKTNSSKYVCRSWLLSIFVSKSHSLHSVVFFCILRFTWLCTQPGNPAPAKTGRLITLIAYSILHSEDETLWKVSEYLCYYMFSLISEKQGLHFLIK